MPELNPFAAVRYARPSGDLSTLIAPPYDVLDEGPKRQMLAADPHNIVDIDLPVTPPKTLGPDEAYDRAGRTFRQWLSEGVLVRDAQPAVFAYEQRYELNGKPVARRGLFATLQVEEFNRPGGGIFRHEHTIKGGTDDRLKLMQATAAQLSPVFAVYDDGDQRVAAALAPWYTRKPDVRGTTASDGVEHLLWTITDAQAIATLRATMKVKDVFIADGHHRYTTALNYHKANPGNPLTAGCLFVLVPLQDPGLVVLPTHRVLCGLNGFSIDALKELLQADGRFNLKTTEGNMEQLAAGLPSAGHHAVGLLDPATNLLYTVGTKMEDPLADVLPQQPKVWRTLDVAVFHELLVDRFLRPRFGGTQITYKYPHQLSELKRLTSESPGRLGVVMQPTPLPSVCDVAGAGGVMPPKSTFFYPKLATGLVINPLS